MIIDSHCHLDYPELFDQLDDVLRRAKFNNVNAGNEVQTISNALEWKKL